MAPALPGSVTCTSQMSISRWQASRWPAGRRGCRRWTSKRRPRGDGERSAGGTALRDDANSAGQQSRCAERRLLAGRRSALRLERATDSDVEAARQFYGEQFGWGSDEFMDMGEMGKYRFWDRQGERFGALFDATNGQPPHWRFYFRVPSIAAAKQIAEENRGTVHMGPHQVPSGDSVRDRQRSAGRGVRARRRRVSGAY